MLSCSNSKYQTSNIDGDSVDVEIMEDAETSLSDMIEVLSVETGWYDEKVPQIKIKFKNVSGKPIDKSIEVKYQFIENDEVMYESTAYLHSSINVDWDNGLAKTETYRSYTGYPFGGHHHDVRAKVCYEDNSIIWEGNIAHKVIY